jgi:hypothetical protein
MDDDHRAELTVQILLNAVQGTIYQRPAIDFPAAWLHVRYSYAF